MRHGKAMFVLPEDETFTTQAAANYLGMSRQFFVSLLESGKIKFHRVGSHRRVYFKDLKEYAKTRDEERRSTLSSLFKEMQEDGHYDIELSEITDNAE
jgi:excisionase family DNA binding protein